MAAEWVYRLKPALAAAGVPVAMWYAHGTVSRRLRLAHACANRVLTSSPEGFRLPSRKLSIIGQGIDTDLFDVPLNRRLDPDIVYVGRISPRKRLDLAIRAFAEARRVEPQAGFQLTIVGPCLGAGDQAYKQELLRTATDLGVASHVNWRDYVPPAALPRLYESAFLHLNVSETGSLDKTVLEALSCGCAVLTNNSPFRSVLAPFPGMFVDSTDPIEIGERVAALYRGREQFDPVRLHGLIERDHSFTAYVGKVVRELQQLAVSEKSR
jgi:glycosyltransferase involved in cell wall biosynthesis